MKAPAGELIPLFSHKVHSFFRKASRSRKRSEVIQESPKTTDRGCKPDPSRIGIFPQAAQPSHTGQRPIRALALVAGFSSARQTRCWVGTTLQAAEKFLFCIRARLYSLRKNSPWCQPRTLVRGSGFSNPRERFGISIEGFSPGGGRRLYGQTRRWVGHDFTGCGKIYVLYRGTALAGPYRISVMRASAPEYCFSIRSRLFPQPV
jgi:hypothetical protein